MNVFVWNNKTNLWHLYTLFGLAVFSIFFIFFKINALPSIGQMGHVLAFAILVIVPLGLSFTIWEKQSFSYSLAKYFHPVAALFALASLCIEDQMYSGVLALPWLLQTIVIAFYGLKVAFFLHKNETIFKTKLPIISIVMGFFYLPVAGTWLVLSNFGISLGFRAVIVFLTAVHFHFAGFALSIINGITGFKLEEVDNLKETIYQKIYHKIGWIVVFSPIFVGLGISFSRTLEMISSFFLAAAIICISGLSAIAFSEKNIYTRNLLRISFLSMIVTMVLAAIYATSRFLEVEIISIPKMIVTHGFINAFGFTFCSFLAWFIDLKKVIRN